jgi:hypothetical protein
MAQKERFVPWDQLQNRHPPQWTCKLWEELFELKGVMECANHDRPLDIVALDGVSRLCRVGAQRDSYEFLALLHRDMESRGAKVAPLVFCELYEDEA